MKCPICQQDNPEGDRFCNGCGTRLIAATPSAAPQAYTPAHLAEKILTSRTGRREQLDQDLRDWGFAVAPRRHG